MKSSYFFLALITSLSIVSNGCSIAVNASNAIRDPQQSPLPSGTATFSATPFPALTDTPLVVPPTYTPTSTLTPFPTDTPTATNTLLPTSLPVPSDTYIPSPTIEVTYNPGEQVIAPILLYHHVSDALPGNRYFVTLADFRTQLQALRDWGYTAITPTDLANVLIYGGELPERPVLLTFDDGNIDIYQNALPIMQEFGFVGTEYIIGTYFQTPSKYFMNIDQIKALADAGWEIGSHSMSHKDLTKDYSILNYEVRQSKLTLEEATGQPVNTFSYPYGETDSFVTTKVSEYGYLAAVGLGLNYKQSLATVFYFTRIEVRGDYNFAKFASLLPWSGD